MNEKLERRSINGKVSETHFYYVDAILRKWSIVDMKKMMTHGGFQSFMDKNNLKYEDMFDYNFEAMLFSEKGAEEQLRGMSAEELIEKIDNER